MKTKKTRGTKRKLNQLVTNIKEETTEFPTEFSNGYWHLHIPGAQDFIESEKTPHRAKRKCLQTLIEQAKHLTALKPTDGETYRVVVVIKPKYLWTSQLIIFKGDEHFSWFFNRTEPTQKWVPLSNTKQLDSNWDLSIPNQFDVFGYRESITDEDFHFEQEIYFISDFKKETVIAS